jgi:hypothetical protein
MKKLTLFFFVLLFLAAASANAQKDLRLIKSIVDNLQIEENPVERIEFYREQLASLINNQERRSRFLFFGAESSDMKDLYDLQMLMTQYKIRAATIDCQPFAWTFAVPSSLSTFTPGQPVVFERTKEEYRTLLEETLQKFHAQQQEAFETVFDQQSTRTAEWQNTWLQWLKSQDNQWITFDMNLHNALKAVNENICALQLTQTQQQLAVLWIEILKQANLVKTKLLRYKNLKNADAIAKNVSPQSQ